MYLQFVDSAFISMSRLSSIGGMVVRSMMLATVGSVLIACESPDERAAGHLASAHAFYDEGDLVKAELEVKNALQIKPANSRARFFLANINESRREYQEMASNLRIAIESDPDYGEARIKLGMLYALGGALDLAEEQAQALVPPDSESAGAQILNARIVAAKGDLPAAKSYLEEALRLEPANMQALGLLASVSASTDLDGALELVASGIAQAEDDRPLRLLRIQLLQQAGNRESEVEAEYRGLVNDYPEETAFGYQLARFLASDGRVEEIEPVLKQIVRNDPENIEARLALIQFIANARGIEAAEELLQQYTTELLDAYQLRLTLARLYQQTARPDDAFAEYERVAELAGNEDAGLSATARMAGIKLTAGETEEGEALLEDVLSVDAMNSEALMLRGALNIDRENYRGAVSDLRSLLRVSPENTQAQLLIARAHSQAGDRVLAEDAYRRVLETAPGNSVATLELARILVGREKLDDAEDLLRVRLQIEPADIRSSRILIGLLLSQDKADEAIAEAQRVGQLEQQEAIGAFLLGGIYQSQDKHAMAVTQFKASLRGKPNAREPLRGLVSSLVKQDKADAAIQYLRQVQKDNPDNLYAQTLLGQVLAGSGDQEAAQTIFESTLQTNESWLPGYTALAGLQSDLGSQIDIYKRGLEAVPGNQELALLLGTAYERDGRVEDAIASYEGALKANSELPAVANNLAALLADYRTDKRSFERALELTGQFEDSENPAFLDTRGWIHFRLGDIDAALPLLESAVAAAGQVPVLRYHLGMAYLAADKESDAKRELEAALQDPDAQFVGRETAVEALAEL
jgi:tetratricopeptide (TPR) repeat protein